MYHNLINWPPVDGHLYYFQAFATTNSSAVSEYTWAYVSAHMWVYMYKTFLEVEHN